MFKVVLLLASISIVAGCGSYSAYSPPPTPQQQAESMRLMHAGAYLLNQATAAPPTPQATNCISRAVGGQIHTTCY